MLISLNKMMIVGERGRGKSKEKVKTVAMEIAISLLKTPACRFSVKILLEAKSLRKAG